MVSSFYSTRVLASFSTHHLLTILLSVDNAHFYCSSQALWTFAMFLRVIHLSTLCEGFMQSTMDNVDVETIGVLLFVSVLGRSCLLRLV
jgi:hypothetical protein